MENNKKPDAENLLQVCDIYKSFGDNAVLKGMTLSLASGEVLSLIGGNGAGKSTLMKIIMGIYTHDSGKVIVNGKEMTAGKTTEALSSGVYMVPQEPLLFPNMTVEENILIGFTKPQSELHKELVDTMKKIGWNLELNRKANTLSIAEQQLVELLRGLLRHAKILILDEPTSQLDPIAASDFLGTVKKINRDLGTTILLTEHRLEEVFPAADRVVVMEGGEVLCMGTPEAIGEELKKQNHEMFLAMPVPMQIYAKVNSGKHMECPITVRDGRNWLNAICKEKQIRPQEAEFFGKDAKEKLAKEEIILEAKDIWFRYDKDQPDVVKGLNLSLKRGEFFALLGGNGTGKSTTLSIISRLRKPYRGKVLLEGKDIRRYSEKELFRGFLGVLPQNPQSLFVKKTVELELFEMVGGTKEKKNEEYHLAMEKCKAVEGIVKVTHLEGLLHRHPYDLSGGEQQRLALAKVVLLRPKILLMDEPTSALDEENKSYLIQELARMKQQSAILFVSHDDAAIRTLCDELLVMQNGTIAERGTTSNLVASPQEEWTKEFVRLASTEEGGGWTWSKSPLPM